jgi:large subunit ribosomal protein L4
MELNLALPGKKTGKETVSLSDESFDKAYNEPLVHQTVVTYMAGARQGSVKQKTRSEVRGGGRKPWRQKQQENEHNKTKSHKQEI